MLTSENADEFVRVHAIQSIPSGVATNVEGLPFTIGDAITRFTLRFGRTVLFQVSCVVGLATGGDSLATGDKADTWTRFVMTYRIDTPTGLNYPAVPTDLGPVDE